MGQEVAMRDQTPARTIDDWVESENIKQKFNEVLDKGAPAFVTSILSLVKSTPQLAAADPKTVISAAMTAATLKLPINPNLGFAYIVPYKDTATFQMGYKGYIQLAMRTGQYKTINASVVYEGQIEDVDFVTGEIIRGKKKSDKVVGYVAYFELINGFSKMVYMSHEDMLRHALTYSQAYKYDRKNGKKSSMWSTNFEAMGLKTVLKQLISKYGIMSIDMQGAGLETALSADNADSAYDHIPQNVTSLEAAADAQTIEAAADVHGSAPEELSAPPTADPLEGLAF